MLLWYGNNKKSNGALMHRRERGKGRIPESRGSVVSPRLDLGLLILALDF